MTSLSICQSHDCLSVNPIVILSRSPSVHRCLLSILSVQPSAKFTVRIPMSIPGRKFLKVQIPGKFPSIHTSSDLSVDPSGSLSVTPSASPGNPSKFPSNRSSQFCFQMLVWDSPDLMATCHWLH